MKYSIRKKMFLIYMSTTLMSFLLVLICFNLISGYHIKQESSKALNQAASVAYSIDVLDSEVKMADSIDAMPITPAEGIVTSSTPPTVKASLVKESLSSSDSSDIGFIMIDTKNKNLVYPAMTITDAQPMEMKKSEDIEIQAVKSFVSKNETATPTRVALNGNPYYLMETKMADGSTAVFYKNVQPLEELAADFNLALLVLLFTFGMVTVAITMGLTNGMVRSIRQLCSLANDIGTGNFQKQYLGLKEKELAVLESDMNEMARKLGEYDNEQKTFFQNVSHELRTPLMSIQGYAEGITSHVFEGDDLGQAANVILTESDRLTELVDNLLYLSRADGRKPWSKVEEFNCFNAINEAVEQASSLGSEIIIDFPPVLGGFSVMGNEEEFKHAVLNILTNGLRYASSKVSVLVSCEERTIQITDDGAGIGEEDLPHIFKRFYKGEGGCSGLGLSISRASIESCNGTILAENRKAEKGECGAMFTIYL